MKPDELQIEFASLVEQVCYPLYDRESGNQEPISAEQWDILSDRFLKLCAKNKIKEGFDGLPDSAKGFPY